MTRRLKQIYTMGNVVTDQIREQTLIIIPAYNEGMRVIQTYHEVLKAGFKNILIIDDGSKVPITDIPLSKIVRHSINRGQGAAIQTGFLAGLMGPAKIFVTLDGDGQFSAADIDTLILPIADGTADVVIGNRFLQKNRIPPIRRIYNFTAKLIAFLLAGLWVGDSQSGFKAFSRDAASSITISTNGYEFCTEIIREVAAQNLRIKEVPVHVYYSKETLKKGQNFAGGVTTVFKLIVRSLMN